MPAGVPLSTLLSQALVAFTIEFDNEFEHQMPHRTTASKSAAASRDRPWLVSMAMWSNLMQFVGKQGAAVGELQSLARTTKLLLTGMERWGYIVVEPKPRRRDWVVRPTPNGRRAQEIWRPLFGVVEKRWGARFGRDEIRRLRESLASLISQFDSALPDFLPVLGYGMFAEVFRGAGRDNAVRGVHLPALLSKVLLAFTIDFERDSDLSLAISANVVRLLTDEGVRARDVPRLAGVSKEAIKMVVGYLAKGRFIVVENHLVRLTPKGRLVRDAYRRQLDAIGEQWQSKFGKDEIRNLRKSLEQISPLFAGLEPYPDGWRALVPKPETLPHHPMVLHRGGYPDGS